MTILALEIGPTRFAAGRISETAGAQDTREIPTPAHSAWDHCRDLLLEVAGTDRVLAVGIAASGPIDMTAGVIASNAIPEWRAGFAIEKAVKELFPHAVVLLTLDGVCLAMAERQFGAARDVPDSVTINVTSRITGGITIGGLALVGRTGNAGNIGHVLVPGFDDVCECGGHGCLEAVAGGTAMLRWARARGWSGNDGKALITSGYIGEETAVSTLERAGTALGRAIASVAALLDVDLVIVGGNMAGAGPALWIPMRRAVSDHARLGYLPGLRVVGSDLGDNAILIGAGLLALATQQRARPNF
ncbi:ROK family protein [Nocardia sp. 2]|uniref:ROK family protein n=1 Tax=Nocardia acididurans TaxID=2802282 RepID=A0ABS1MGF6_9NOCA|nr:ROK family protein [Nocardia acididurans]MBL1079745.1 ROK family protein [Nocardia acididurans]